MTLNVGDRSPFDIDDLYRLPLGSTLVHTGGLVVHRSITGFSTDDGETQPLTGFTRQGWELTSVGPIEVADTLERFKHRLWTATMGAGSLNSITPDHLTTALEAVDASFDPVLRPGMWVHLHHRDLASRLPRGTVIREGTPFQHEQYRVSTMPECTRLLGGMTGTQRQMLQVLAYPDDTPVVEWAPAAPDELEQIDAFRRRVWTEGQKFKTTHRWCGVYESTVAQLFIVDQPSTPDVTPGVDSQVTRSDMERAPTGAQVRDVRMTDCLWEKEEDGWHQHQHGRRSDHANPVTNFAISPLRWVRWGVLSPNSEAPVDAITALEYGTPVPTVAEQEALPYGSVLGWQDPVNEPGNWNYMVRVEGGQYRTAHLCGTNSGCHGTGPRTRLIHYGPAEQVAIPVESHAQMGQMPNGTEVRAGTGAVCYIKDGDLWRQVGGTTHGRRVEATILALVPDGGNPVPVFTHIPGRDVSVGIPLPSDNLTTPEQYDRLPVGTTLVSDSSGNVCDKQADGTWLRRATPFATNRWMTTGYWSVARDNVPLGTLTVGVDA